MLRVVSLGDRALGPVRLQRDARRTGRRARCSSSDPGSSVAARARGRRDRHRGVHDRRAVFGARLPLRPAPADATVSVRVLPGAGLGTGAGGPTVAAVARGVAGVRPAAGRAAASGRGVPAESRRAVLPAPGRRWTRGARRSAGVQPDRSDAVPVRVRDRGPGREPTRLRDRRLAAAGARLQLRPDRGRARRGVVRALAGVVAAGGRRGAGVRAGGDRPRPDAHGAGAAASDPALQSRDHLDPLRDAAADAGRSAQSGRLRDRIARGQSRVLPHPDRPLRGPLHRALPGAVHGQVGVHAGGGRQVHPPGRVAPRLRLRGCGQGRQDLPRRGDPTAGLSVLSAAGARGRGRHGGSDGLRRRRQPPGGDGHPRQLGATTSCWPTRAASTPWWPISRRAA